MAEDTAEEATAKTEIDEDSVFIGIVDHYCAAWHGDDVMPMSWDVRLEPITKVFEEIIRREGFKNIEDTQSLKELLKACWFGDLQKIKEFIPGKETDSDSECSESDDEDEDSMKGDEPQLRPPPPPHMPPARVASRNGNDTHSVHIQPVQVLIESGGASWTTVVQPAVQATGPHQIDPPPPPPSFSSQMQLPISVYSAPPDEDVVMGQQQPHDRDAFVIGLEPLPGMPSIGDAPSHQPRITEEQLHNHESVIDEDVEMSHNSGQDADLVDQTPFGNQELAILDLSSYQPNFAVVEDIVMSQNGDAEPELSSKQETDSSQRQSPEHELSPDPQPLQFREQTEEKIGDRPTKEPLPNLLESPAMALISAELYLALVRISSKQAHHKVLHHILSQVPHTNEQIWRHLSEYDEMMTTFDFCKAPLGPAVWNVYLERIRPHGNDWTKLMGDLLNLAFKCNSSLASSLVEILFDHGLEIDEQAVRAVTYTLNIDTELFQFILERCSHKVVRLVNILNFLEEPKNTEKVEILFDTLEDLDYKPSRIRDKNPYHPKEADQRYNCVGTCLHNAAWYGNDELAWLLLRRDVRRDMKDGEGRTALEVAEERGNLVIKHYLESADECPIHLPD